MAVPVLPPRVAELLEKIRIEQSQPPLESQPLEMLFALGEEAALDVLRNISGSNIRNLNALITYIVKRKYQGAASSSFGSPLPYEASSSLISPERTLRSMESPHLHALGELEFRKAFLILSYVGMAKLEDVMSVDRIRSLKDLPMVLFESIVWDLVGHDFLSEEDRRKSFSWDSNKTHLVGHDFLSEEDRRKSFSWDSNKTHLYQCHVDPDGNCTFKGPFLQTTRTHLQRVLGDDNVLDVRFAEEVDTKRQNRSYALYQRIAKEGILVGLRRYHFFVFKVGSKGVKMNNSTTSSVKCYFVCTDSSALRGKSIHEVRCLFMHMHTMSNMAKYMARFSLILSKTIKPKIDLGSVHVERIGDIPCLDEEGKIVCKEDGKPFIHTDGTGFISEDLALKCPRNIYKGDYLNQVVDERMHYQAEAVEELSISMANRSSSGDPPLLIQVRLFYNGCAVKGTLLVNRKLPPNTIQIRPSMVKVENDPELTNVQSFNSLEVVTTSNRPGKSCLNRQLIALLSYGGVPIEYFLELLMNAFDDARNVNCNKRTALKAVMKSGNMDDFIAMRMILCGIPLNEPYLKHYLSTLMKEKLKMLKGGKLPIDGCYYLMGTADPTGMLNPNEVCVILDHGQISGNILVYKNPGLHFGDIHVVTAVFIKDLENVVGNAKYAIFFPTKGPRSLADEMANSDFDGDMYWVSRNPQLLGFFKASTPWERVPSGKIVQPKEFSKKDLECELFQQFLENRFQPSYTMATSSKCWLSFMDRLLTLGDDCADEKHCLREKMIKLVNIYYDAIDAPKTGMKVEVPKELKAEKLPHFMESSKSYTSNSILGMIYDKVNSFEMEYQPPEDVWQLPLFSQELPHSCLMQWRELYDQYRKEMTIAMSREAAVRDSAARDIIRKYKQILYGAAEFEESPRKREDIFNEALAIYQVTYDYAKTAGIQKCMFVWKVAGRALCMLHAISQIEDPVVCTPAVLHEVFG